MQKINESPTSVVIWRNVKVKGRQQSRGKANYDGEKIVSYS